MSVTIDDVTRAIHEAPEEVYGRFLDALVNKLTPSQHWELMTRLNNGVSGIGTLKCSETLTLIDGTEWYRTESHPISTPAPRWYRVTEDTKAAYDAVVNAAKTPKETA